MRYYWEKLGQLYCLPEQGVHEKLRTHASNPLPVWLEGDIYRIYYSARDKYNRSSVGAVEVDIVKRIVVKSHLMPFFLHGEPGSFFADGVSIGNCYRVGETIYMLFMGWQAPSAGHWRGDIGRLKLESSGALSLDSHDPYFGISAADPISLSYPWVAGSDVVGYRMWYGSTVSWDAGNGEMLHVIHHAHSCDGHLWERQGLAVPFELGRIQAFSRPTVAVAPDGSFEMWFSYRGAPGLSYRIGYAVSVDGLAWRLALDLAGIDVSESGWDSMMIEYPYVFRHRDAQYMLYNGNDYGKTGFGIAVRRSE